MERTYPKNMTSTSNNSSPTTPTTFVQADPNTFKELVQKLTGSSGDSVKLPVTLPSRLPHVPVAPTGPRRSPFKLQDRRQTMRKLEIKLSLASIGASSLRKMTWLDSPVTPLGSESLFLSSGSPSPGESPVEYSEERGFYMHQSRLSTPRASDPPELLNLFPLTSPQSGLRHSRRV